MKTFLLMRLDLSNSGANRILRFTNAPYDIEDLFGDVYQSTGDLLQIGDGSGSETELVSTGLTVSLSGVDPSYQAEIDNNGFLRAPIDLMLVKVPDGSNVATEQIYYHRGLCDTPQTIIDSTSGTITIQIETQSILGDLDKTPSLTKCSFSVHSSRHAGDKFFEYTADAETQEIWWTDL